MGCGSGEFLDLLKKHLPQIEAAGFEINPTAAQQARVKGHKVYEGNFQEFIHSTENRFDVITLFQVLEHLEDPGKYLQQLSILLSANGVIILAVPNAEGPLRFFRDSLTEIPPHHISRWCESAFKIGMPHFGYFVDKIAYEPLPDYLWDQYLPVLWNTGIWPAQICRDIESSLPIDQRMDEWERINWFKQQMKNLNVRWLHSVPGHSIYVVLSKQSNRSNGLEKSLLVKDAVAKIGYDPEAIRIITNLISSIQADISMVIHDQRIETGIRFGKQQTDLKTWSRLLEEEQYKLREWSAQLIKQRQELEEWSAQLTKQRQELKEWSAQLTKQQQKPEKLKKKVGKR